MKETYREPDETLPLELKLRVLQAELDRLSADYEWILNRKNELERQIAKFEARLNDTRRRRALRRVK